MRRFLAFCMSLFFLEACGRYEVNISHSDNSSDLDYSCLATSWDEGVPLGNAIVGALIWQRDSFLRFSIDRADLWDLRPIDSFAGTQFSFLWVQEQVAKNDYGPVQNKLDAPYNQQPAPSKIPGAALEFPLSDLGLVRNVHLYLDNALCEISWQSGMRLKTFVHATDPIGWFVFENIPDEVELIPQLVPPQYQVLGDSAAYGTVDGQDLRRLGYPQGAVKQLPQSIVYHQKGWNDFEYTVAVKWKQIGSSLMGAWSVTSSFSSKNAEEEVDEALARGPNDDYKTHMDYWQFFWNQSSISLPDVVIQKQYDNEMYKFASATREYSYPISLQAVWTADNGKLPPWKGDYHHDLNTQMSYWCTYIGNHLPEGLGYINTLWNQRDVYRQYTRQYFGVEGINVPGVASLTGQPLGGWIQYAMSPTCSAWLSHYFYLHWKYSADPVFLRNRAYPFMKDVALFLENITVINEQHKRTLPLSSSPEIFDNSINAWFKTITNYDLALIRFVFGAAAEMAEAQNLDKEAKHWELLLHQLPDFDLDETGALTFAKGFPYQASHRHFSHAMAFHPLSIIDWSDGERSQQIIKATLDELDKYGTDWWTGYSYSWYANMKARAFDGDGAAEALNTFAKCFCLSNTFHANGDQSQTGKSKFDYRPFTLEGNFAFASAVQEMLLQSHTGTIRIFPAIPNDWKDASFRQLRAVGAFLVSAELKDGMVSQIKLMPERGGSCRLILPDNYGDFSIQGHDDVLLHQDSLLVFNTIENQEVLILPK